MIVSLTRKRSNVKLKAMKILNIYAQKSAFTNNVHRINA